MLSAAQIATGLVAVGAGALTIAFARRQGTRKQT